VSQSVKSVIILFHIRQFNISAFNLVELALILNFKWSSDLFAKSFKLKLILVIPVDIRVGLDLPTSTGRKSGRPRNTLLKPLQRLDDSFILDLWNHASSIGHSLFVSQQIHKPIDKKFFSKYGIKKYKRNLKNTK